MTDSHEPVRCRPLEVVVRVGDDAGRAVRRFMRKVRESGVLDELRRRSRYSKPSEKLREKRRRRAKTSVRV